MNTEWTYKAREVYFFSRTDRIRNGSSLKKYSISVSMGLK